MLAGMTRLQWSGMDSYVGTQFPPDCVLRGKKWTWDYGDGSPTGYGAHVSHQYALAGIYVVTLTFEGDDGTIGTAQETVVITTPDFSSFSRYVSWATGNDSTGTGTQVAPYKTIERAFHDWKSGLPRASWGVIFLNKGETHTFAGLSDATHDSTPDYGPLFITGYGLGTRPLVAIGNFDFALTESHDASFDHAIQWDSVDISWAAPSSHNFEWTHRGCQVTNANVTNGRLVVNSSGGGNSAFANLNNTKALLGPFVSNQFLDFDICLFQGNGTSGFTDPTPDHQLYMSAGVTYAGVRNCILDQTGAVNAFSGIKTSGARKVYILNPSCIANDCGFETGSNPSDRNTQDILYESPKLTGILRFGWYPQSCDRISIRNPVVLQGCSDSVLRLQPFLTGQRITDLQLLLGSVYKPTGQFVYFPGFGQWLTRIVIEGVAVQKAAASGPFLKSEPGLDFTGVTFNGNQYFRDSGSSGQSGFASIGGTDKSFDTWKAGGQDALSQYGDPKFNGPTDLNLQAGSPCIDKGLSLTVVGVDAGGTVRPQGTAYDIGAYEFQNGTTVLIQNPVIQMGFSVSPVIIPCWSGSNQISPFMRGLVYGHSTHDSPAQNFERWADVAANFACWGNGEPLPYVDEEGVTVGPHQGRVSSTLTGPTGPTLNNFLVSEWFEKFIPKAIPFNLLLTDDAHESKPLTTGTGEERRYYYPPPMRRVLFHPDATERQAGWDAIQSINRETIERRPFFHNSKNGNQGGPTPFVFPKGGPPEECNHNLLDQFGNARSWNAVGSRAPYSDGNSWNAWDKQHNAGPTFHLPACIGSRAAMVNLWNNWRWVLTSFYPGSDGDVRGKQFDVPRSVGFGAFLAVYAYLAGFEWADPQMIRLHCGGNANGDGTGQNGNNGWKPSKYFEWIVRSAIGTAIADNGHVQLIPKGFVYFNLGCDNLGEPSCLCDCGAMPPPGPGTSGCNGAAWVGPDGVDYGSQTIGIDLWHVGIECSGLMLIDSLNDYLIKIWGQGAAILTTQTASGLKQLLVYAAQETIYRCINQSGFATAHYYTGTTHSQFGSPTTPRGYTQAVAQAMLNDMFVCHPDKAVGCEIRQINDGSGQWIVAEKARTSVDLFYSLSMPWLMYVLGPNHPTVIAWLTSGQFIPPPGQEGGDQKTDYENHARFTDFAWALNENGTAVFIPNSTMSFGVAQDGNQAHPVIIQASTIQFGVATDGNYGKVVIVKAGTLKFGAKISGQVGKNIAIPVGPIMFATSIDGVAQQPVIITSSTVSVGAKNLGNFAVSGGGTTVNIPNGRMRVGATVLFTGLRIGNAVIIIATPVSFGASCDAGQVGLWSLSTMQFGLALDATVQADRSVLILKQTLSLGAAIKKGTAKIGHKNSFDASGTAIVVEG